MKKNTSYQRRVDACKNLQELADTLNLIGWDLETDYPPKNRPRLSDVVDLENLPTFGEISPEIRAALSDFSFQYDWEFGGSGVWSYGDAGYIARGYGSFKFVPMPDQKWLLDWHKKLLAEECDGD